jgi:hypothetical protein
VLFGQYGADEADQGVAVGEDADDVGAAPDFFVESFPLTGPRKTRAARRREIPTRSRWWMDAASNLG